MRFANIVGLSALAILSVGCETAGSSYYRNEIYIEVPVGQESRTADKHREPVNLHPFRIDINPRNDPEPKSNAASKLSVPVLPTTKEPAGKVVQPDRSLAEEAHAPHHN